MGHSLFVSKALDKWSYGYGVTMDLSKAGKTH